MTASNVKSLTACRILMHANLLNAMYILKQGSKRVFPPLHLFAAFSSQLCNVSSISTVQLHCQHFNSLVDSFKKLTDAYFKSHLG